MDLALGVVAAVTASALFSVGLVLQSLEARTLPAGPGLRLAALGLLVRRRRWVGGGALMVVGFAFHVAALALAPLTVVQPALAAGLVVLLVAGARTEGQPVGARERVAVVTIALALVALTLTAPARTVGSSDATALAVALGALAAIALLPEALAGRHDRKGLAATAGAGAAYALTGVTTKLASDAIAAGDGAGGAAWLAVTVGGALVALTDQTAALQRRAATQVGVVLYVVPVVVPVLLAPVLVGEPWSQSPGSGLPLALALGAVCWGAAALARSRQVRAIEGGPEASGGGDEVATAARPASPG